MPTNEPAARCGATSDAGNSAANAMPRAEACAALSPVAGRLPCARRPSSRAAWRLLSAFKARVKTLTFGNGLEFARHGGIDRALESMCYFADPYASWRRGTNENTNGLIRRYLPKSRPLHTVTREELARTMDRLNHRPGKRLGRKTPHQVFMQSFRRVALRG